MGQIINCSIDFNSINQDKLVVHSNGCKYFNFTVSARQEPDKYGNTHYIVEAQTKEERLAKAPKNYLKSSGKEFVYGGAGNSGNAQPQAANTFDNDDDDLPF